MDSDFKAECQAELEVIATYRETWKQRLPELGDNGSPPGQLLWLIEDHIKGLDDAAKRLKEIVRKHEAWQNSLAA